MVEVSEPSSPSATSPRPPPTYHDKHRDQSSAASLRYVRGMWSGRPLSTITLADLQSLITDKLPQLAAEALDLAIARGSTR